MYEWFGAIGEVVSIRIAEFPDTGKRKGFAHVQFATHEAAVKAVEFNGEDLDGRPCRIDLAEGVFVVHVALSALLSVFLGSKASFRLFMFEKAC